MGSIQCAYCGRQSIPRTAQAAFCRTPCFNRLSDTADSDALTWARHDLSQRGGAPLLTQATGKRPKQRATTNEIPRFRTRAFGAPPLPIQKAPTKGFENVTIQDLRAPTAPHMTGTLYWSCRPEVFNFRPVNHTNIVMRTCSFGGYPDIVCVQDTCTVIGIMTITFPTHDEALNFHTHMTTPPVPPHRCRPPKRTVDEIPEPSQNDTTRPRQEPHHQHILQQPATPGMTAEPISDDTPISSPELIPHAEPRMDLDAELSRILDDDTDSDHDVSPTTQPQQTTPPNVHNTMSPAQCGRNRDTKEQRERADADLHSTPKRQRCEVQSPDAPNDDMEGIPNVDFPTTAVNNYGVIMNVGEPTPPAAGREPNWATMGPRAWPGGRRSTGT